MSIRGGQIMHLGGNQTVLDRLQSAGIGDINIGTDVVHEVGNPNNVDKIQQDPDFTFSMESFDVSTEVEALLCGVLDGGPVLADGTMWRFSDMKSMHVSSPWKTEASGSAGVVDSGVLLPNYTTTRAQYRFGVTDNAGETFDLAGSAYYMAPANPAVEMKSGNGATKSFATASAAVRHRVGGYSSSSLAYVFGVIVDGDVQVEGADYTVTTPGSTAAETATILFGTAPANGADITIAYFANTAPYFPDTTAIHPAPTVKPAAVRGRDIKIMLHIPAGGYEASGTVTLNGIQSVTLEGSKTTEIEREMGTVLPIGRTVTSQDVTGDIGLHPATSAHLFTMLRRITGVASGEVISVLNEYPVGLEVQILNPRNRASVLKTLFVKDAKIQIPGVPARAAAITDFTLRYESQSGEFYVFKGAASSFPS